MDLIVSGEQSSDYYRYAESTLLSRLNIPLHIVIQDRVDESSDANELSSAEIDQLLRFLRPALPRVFAMEIKLKFNSPLLLNCVVSSWMRGYFGDRSRILKIWNSSHNNPVLLKNSTEFSSQDTDYDCKSKSLLDSVETLVTRNCHLGLGVETLNVKRLNLEHLYGTSLKRFQQILSVCRVLHTLLIEDIDFSLEEGAAEPFWINSLENLCLAQVQTEHFLRHLLPLLNTTSPISLILRMSPKPNFVFEAQGFFRRSNVKRIFLYGNDRYQLGSVISLCPAQKLQELILRDCTLEIDSGEGNTSSVGRTVWPLLHTLYLIGCTIDRGNLKQLLDLHPIQKLRIFGGYANPFCFHRLLADECLELEEFLSRPNLDVKAVINEDHCPDRSNFFDGAYA
ncbi:F-box-like domain-containing protein [Ceratobasidium sp. AG-Ba]|nr:F-box-like domain-containing protein [Ceratobasidium sp. AG-Ba]QRW11626.1 F-box-like domain-containing protein [Ceratobasidium sp. AG-Ba]